jgi:hypothetical protein
MRSGAKLGRSLSQISPPILKNLALPVLHFS